MNRLEPTQLERSIRWNTLVSDTHRLIYVGTPKAACTTVKWWFAALEGLSQTLLSDQRSQESDPDLTIHDLLPLAFPAVCGLPADTLLAKLASSDYFRFALVRNPYSRVFSAWQSKLLMREPLQIGPYAEFDFMRWPIDSSAHIATAFEAFLEHLLNHEFPNFWDIHWEPQATLLQPDRINYQLIAKVEHPESLEQGLRQHLGKAWSSPLADRRANECLIPYSPSLLTAKSAALIKTLYAEDFAAFGYAAEPPPSKRELSQPELQLALQGLRLIRGRHRRLGEIRAAMQAECNELRRELNMSGVRTLDLERLQADQTTAMAALERQAREKTQTIEEVKATLGERDRLIADLRTVIAERSEQLGRLNQLAQESRDAIAELTENAKRDAQDIEGLNQQIVQLEHTARESAAQMHSLDRALSDKDTALDELTRLTDHQKSELGRLHELKADSELQIAELTHVVSEYRLQIDRLNSAISDREATTAELNARLGETTTRLNETTAKLHRILASNSWLITKPLRFVRRKLVSETGASARRGAYSGLKTVWQKLPLSDGRRYRLKSFLFHHFPWAFSRSEAYRNWRLLHFSPVTQDKLSTAPQKITMQQPASGDFVPLFNGTDLADTPVKLISFYLPQFHPIPENDKWWGTGFTEWTNVKPATQQFVGHYQPRQPGELGYYDLRDKAIQHRQIELAKLYGIGGFCFYFYWFGGKRLLEEPLENYLRDASLDLPFCLCWANENWSRRWDGLENELLITQQHSPQDDLAFIGYVSKYLRDPRYIRVNGKPVLVVYRPSELPDAKATAERWRKWCRQQGVGEIYLAYTQSFETVDPSIYGFDAAIEFPPNNSAPPVITDKVAPLNEDFNCIVYDWRVFVERSEKYNEVPYKLFRSVCPSWDNTARRKNNSSIFLNSSPTLYQRWLENAIRDTEKRHANSDERLIFVNAWNEWAEGAYLEPDERYGYAYLQATRNALSRAPATAVRPTESILLVTHDCHPHGAQFLLLETARAMSLSGFRVVILTLGGGRLLPDFSQVGPTYNLNGKSDDEIAGILATIRAGGTVDVITNTVVSGTVVPQLKAAGFRVLSLIHELPGVIRAMKQEENAARIARFSDKVVFPAQYVRERFKEFADIPQGKVHIRPQGLLRKNPYKGRREEARRIVCEKHGFPVDTKFILNVGYADTRKGADLFVEIAARLVDARSNIACLWVGHADPVVEKQVMQRIAELKLEDRVLFLGFNSNPLVYYAAASVYALTSREDPFPNVVLESAEVGVPVVGFKDASGAADFILENGGLLAEHSDVDDFAAKVRKLLSEPPAQPTKQLGTLKHYALDLLHYLNGFPRISAIVPNYNYGNHIQERLDTVCHQTLPIYELIVLDDASTDHSVKLVSEHLDGRNCDYSLIVNTTNSGSVFRQWKKGIESCNGDIVWIAEADDVADTGFLRALCMAFRDPNVVMAYCQSKQIDTHGTILAPDYLEYTRDISDAWLATHVHDGKDEIRDALSIKNTVPNVSAALFRRESLLKAFQDVGETLFGYKIAGDWLIYLHVLLQGKIYFNKQALNLHRRHASSVTNATQKQRHIEEVAQLQEIARSLVKTPTRVAVQSKSYLDYLYKHFNVAPNEAERDIRAKRAL